VVYWGMNRKHYSTDLTDREWAIIEPLVPAPKPGGRPCRWSRREILNGIFYVVRSGGSWRLLPHDLPPWQTVYHYFRLWRLDGSLEHIHTRLREQLRTRLGRHPTPSAAILDSQSVKTTQRGGSAATTAASRSRGASGTWSSTPRG
jgi:putative transposase